MHFSLSISCSINALLLLKKAKYLKSKDLLSLTQDDLVCQNLMYMAAVICPEHYRTLNDQGWDKTRVQEFLYTHAVRPLSDLKKGGYIEKPIEKGDENIPIRAVQSPDDILLIVAGGIAGRFSACIPGWANKHASHSVTRSLREVTCGT